MNAGNAIGAKDEPSHAPTIDCRPFSKETVALLPEIQTCTATIPAGETPAGTGAGGVGADVVVIANVVGAIVVVITNVVGAIVVGENVVGALVGALVGARVPIIRPSYICFI